MLGLALYTAPTNGTTYYRTTFLAQTVEQLDDAELDPDIHAVHWLDYEEILARADRMRSPLALAVIERYRRGEWSPLELIHEP